MDVIIGKVCWFGLFFGYFYKWICFFIGCVYFRVFCIEVDLRCRRVVFIVILAVGWGGFLFVVRSIGI